MGASLRESLKKERTWTVAQGTHNLLQRTGPNSLKQRESGACQVAFLPNPGAGPLRSRTSEGSLSTEKAMGGWDGALAPKGALLKVCK